MCNIATNEAYIAQLPTTPFRWGWDSKHWAPWMLHYPRLPTLDPPIRKVTQWDILALDTLQSGAFKGLINSKSRISC
jgi:hypothetical protein